MKDLFTQNFFKKYIPKKYWERVKALEPESGLIDNCKYMLLLNSGWSTCEKGFWAVPVRSFKEAKEFIAEAFYDEDEVSR